MVDFYGINVYFVLILWVWLNDWRIQTLHYDCCSAKKHLNKMVKVAALSQILFLIPSLKLTASAPLKIDEFSGDSERRFHLPSIHFHEPFGSWSQLSQLRLGIHTASKGIPQRNRCQVTTPPPGPWIFHGHFWVVNNHKKSHAPHGWCHNRWKVQVSLVFLRHRNL